MKQTSELAHSALHVAMATAIGHGDKDLQVVVPVTRMMYSVPQLWSPAFPCRSWSRDEICAEYR